MKMSKESIGPQLIKAGEQIRESKNQARMLNKCFASLLKRTVVTGQRLQ